MYRPNHERNAPDPTDKITRTEYMDMEQVFAAKWNTKRFYFTEKLEEPIPRQPTYWDHSTTTDVRYHDNQFGGFFGKVKVQWFIPKGGRVERIRITGIEE